VASVVVDSSIQVATRRRAWAFVVKCSSSRSSNSTVECQLSMTALSSAEPARPIDCWIATRPQAAWKFSSVFGEFNRLLPQSGVASTG
jgi:hypothetical protein